jgi:hypothetical protein
MRRRTVRVSLLKLVGWEIFVELVRTLISPVLLTGSRVRLP